LFVDHARFPTKTFLLELFAFIFPHSNDSTKKEKKEEEEEEEEEEDGGLSSKK
jgi:hypothetical protein